MVPNAAKSVPGAAILVLVLLLSPPWLHAQAAGATLSGTITNQSGAPVPNAKISVKNAAGGQPVETHTDSAGHYTLPNLAAGEYEVSVSAEGFSTNVSKVTITTAAEQTLNLTLGGALSLGELGFPKAEIQGSAQEQARLDKRSHMLKVHQRLGLITTGPLVATVLFGAVAGGRSTSSTNRDVHAALGSLTAGLYGATAYYAFAAPKIAGTKTRGQIRLHKILVWIHGPGMVLTPILGAMAFNQKSKGERVHGIARAHGPVAIVTAAAYGLAIVSVSVKF
jgi:Carboxypeptidase regulatory-like domain